MDLLRETYEKMLQDNREFILKSKIAEEERLIQKANEIVSKYGKREALMIVDFILENDCGYNAYEGVTENELMIDTEYWKKMKKYLEN